MSCEWWHGQGGSRASGREGEMSRLRRFEPSREGRTETLWRPRKHANMKELQIQHRGRPYRVLFAFDLRHAAILLIGENKTGKGRWYKEFVPIADRLYDDHLATLRREGSLDG